MVTDVQYTQSVEQVGLGMVAILSHRRLHPDFKDRFNKLDKPTSGSYLADQDAHFQGHSLGNSARVAERRPYGLCVATDIVNFRDQHWDLTMFLETVLVRRGLTCGSWNRGICAMAFFKGTSCRSSRRRLDGQRKVIALLQPTKASADRPVVIRIVRERCVVTISSST